MSYATKDLKIDLIALPVYGVLGLIELCCHELVNLQFQVSEKL